MQNQEQDWYFEHKNQLIKSRGLGRISWLVHGATTRRFNSEGEDKTPDLERLAVLLGFAPQAYALADQVHGTRISVVDSQRLASHSSSPYCFLPETDGIITSLPNVMLHVFTADCVPVFIVDTHTRRVGILHAGWLGTLDQLASKVVQQLTTLGSRTADLMAWIGPAIRKCCYEISPELMRQFRKRFSACSGFFDGRHLDLPLLNYWQLEVAGIPETHISLANLCTKCNQDLLYSYRGNRHNKGRIISFLAIRQ
jgi:YfiH family protein